MKRIIFLWAMLMMAAIPLWADEEVSFTASAPDAVAVGDQFRLSYTITTQESGISVSLPSVDSMC